LAVDGNRLVPLDGELIRGRNRAIYNGSAVVTVAINGNGGLAAEPEISTIGLIEEGEEDIMGEALEAARKAVEGLTEKKRRDDDEVRETVRIAVRRTFRKSLNKKPLTTVHLVRV
jgi:ribonuclease J